MIFVTSDLHFNHKNIINFSRPQFKTLQEHDQFIVEQYNSVVNKDDLVYILGDLGFSPANILKELVKQLNGRKILIIGNHDRLKDSEYFAMGFIEVIHHPIYYNNNIILSHLPVKECYDNPWVINVHGHIHNGNLDLPNYFNVNVEENNYKPINISYFEEKAQQICQRYRWQRFGSEWYSQWEKHHNK